MSVDNRKLIKLDKRPEGTLTGVKKMKQRLGEDLVGDWFVDKSNTLFLRVYHHEDNIILWFRLVEA
jgi:hypothetical protein